MKYHVLLFFSLFIFVTLSHSKSDDFFSGLNPDSASTDDFFQRIPSSKPRPKPAGEEFNPIPGERFECIPSTDLLGKPLYLGNLKIVNAYLSNTCSFHVYYTIDSKRFRRLMFTEEGAVDFFLSRPQGTAARTFYPVSGNKPSLALRISTDQSILEILHPSGEVIEISTRTGEVHDFSNVEMRFIDWAKDPRDGNSPFKSYQKGILLDSGVRWGVDPRRPVQGKGSAMHLRTSNLINSRGLKCKVPNYFLFDYEYDYRGDVDHVLFRFSSSLEPQTMDFRQLEEIRDSLPPKFRAAFSKKIKLIPRNLAPKSETFEQYVSRLCPEL